MILNNSKRRLKIYSICIFLIISILLLIIGVCVISIHNSLNFIGWIIIAFSIAMLFTNIIMLAINLSYDVKVGRNRYNRRQNNMRNTIFTMRSRFQYPASREDIEYINQRNMVSMPPPSYNEVINSNTNTNIY